MTDCDISDDPRRLDVALIHGFLSEDSYWARGVPLAVVERAIAHSLNLGVYDGQAQIAYARIVTDRATFAYLCDVFVLPTHRGQGVGKALMNAVIQHPDLQGLRRFMLGTRDAHSLYRRHGFETPARPDRLMERLNPDVYGHAAVFRDQP